MDSISETNDVASGKTRSLRARRGSVNYAENEDNEDNHQPTEKKRGAKRKAEVNIESLYRQENVKEVTPQLLETIFESPKKVQNRSRASGSKINNNICNLSVEDQLMSLKKMKRFCAFSNHYNPTKQKTKTRKDRAKKLKQLTGIEVPKGIISNEELASALSVLSEDEELHERSVLMLCNEDTIEVDNDKEPCDETLLSFYEGNVIKPDDGESSINEVIKNISMMQMEANLHNEKDLPQIFIKDLEKSLLFSNENDNPNLPPVQSKEKRSRRRSQKHFGNLLLLKSDIEQLPDLKSGAFESKKMGRAECLESPMESLKQEELNGVSSTPKRRNSLSDVKIVKKTKLVEPSLKRESEYGDEKCLKKRGSLQDKIGKSCNQGKSENERNVDADSENTANSLFVVHEAIEFKKSKTYSLSVTSSVQPTEKKNGPGKGKKRGSRRRVSGIERPLYRTVLKCESPENDLDISERCSPVYLETKESMTQSSIASFLDCQYISTNDNSQLDITSNQGNKSQNGTSSTSPCTQMAALTIHSPDTALHERPLRKSRRRSERLSLKSMINSSVPSHHASNLAPSSEVSLVHINTDINKGDQEVKKRKGRRLSNLFSQLELRSEIATDSVISSVTNDCSKNDVTSKNSRKSTTNIGYSYLKSQARVAITDIMVSTTFTSTEDQQNAPTSDELINRDVSQSLASVNESATEAYTIPLCNPNLNSEAGANKQCEHPKSSLNLDDTVFTELKGQNISGSEVANPDQNRGICFAENADKHTFNMCIPMDDLACNSPILTGVFENKTIIRQGKVYQNPNT